MKIIVPIKRVPDQQVVAHPRADGAGVDLSCVRMVLNPFDENALEAAVRLKEQGVAQEVVVVSFGDQGVQEVLRQALALGATRAIWGQVSAAPDQLAVAKLLRHLVQTEAAEVVILGKQAVDEDAGQTAQMLAALLDWPQATAVSALEWLNGSWRVRREIDGGTETLEISGPAVFSADLTLNVPRFAKLPDLMRARKHLIETLNGDSVGLDLVSRARVIRLEAAPARASGQIVASVEELVTRLRQEARVIA